MIYDTDAAKYFISKDNEHQLFNADITERDGRLYCDGNIRLNKFLHLAQNIYYAKTGRALIDTIFYAYDDGAAIPKIRECYFKLICEAPYNIKFDYETTVFLDRFYQAFKNASVDELIELSREDIEWKEKYLYFDNESQKMDMTAHPDEYRQQYADIIDAMSLL